MYALLIGLLMLAIGCQPETPSEPLQPVPLPNLQGLPEAAQQQIRLQHAQVQGIASRLPPDTLAPAFGKLGQLLFTYDFLDAAEPAFRNAATLAPANDAWPYYLGMLYRQRGDFEAAEAQYAGIVEQDPANTLARLRLAEVLIQQGRSDEAQPLLDAVLVKAPQTAFAHFLLGQIASEEGAYEDAVRHYEAALELQPDASQVHAPLGLAYRNLGDEAKSTYHLARRGPALVRLRDARVQALEAFKQASGATALTQGQALIDAGRYQEAIAALEQAVKQDSLNASAHLSLGVARSYAGDRAGAIAAFEKTIDLDPGSSNALYNLGAIYSDEGDQKAAASYFREAIGADPRHGKAQLELAELLRRAGRCAEALPHFTQALAIIPGDIAARQHQTLCLIEQGQYATARALLEEGLLAFPDHVGFIDALARVLAASPDDAVRDSVRALDLAKQAVTVRRRTETLETLAMAQAAMGNYDEAATIQQTVIEQTQAANHAAYLAHLRTNLRRYEQHQPSRTPWPTFMYEM